VSWGFYVVHNGDKAIAYNPQQLQCILCHPRHTNLNPANAIRNSKRFLTSNKDNGIITLNKHVQCDHVDEYNIWVLYLKQQKQGLEIVKNRQQHKKRKLHFHPKLLFFGSTIPYHKSDLAQHTFLEVLCLYIAKGYRLLSLVENLWLKGFVMHENPKVVFPSRHRQEIFFHMVSKKWIIMFFQL
jgi:hypothetical protein